MSFIVISKESLEKECHHENDLYESDVMLVGFFLPNGKFKLVLGFDETELDESFAFCSYLNGGAKPNGY